jgi:hypothetical protein
MEYSKLVAVTGLPGLFELINSKTDGAIVRSLEDKSSRFVSSRIHNFSHLESIEVYTIRDNVNLVDVLNAMDKAGVNLPDEKDAAAIKSYFEKVYPDMDFERVYASDMKKMVKWYSQLKKNDVELKLSDVPQEEEEAAPEAEAVAAPVTEEAPAKAKKAPAKKKEEAAEEKAETPKKTARKKKAD